MLKQYPCNKTFIFIFIVMAMTLTWTFSDDQWHSHIESLMKCITSEEFYQCLPGCPAENFFYHNNVEGWQLFQSSMLVKYSKTSTIRPLSGLKKIGLNLGVVSLSNWFIWSPPTRKLQKMWICGLNSKEVIISRWSVNMWHFTEVCTIFLH